MLCKLEIRYIAILSIYFLFCILSPLRSIGQLVSGDIAFVQYNADGTDNFAFVALIDIPGLEVIIFTDNEPGGLTGGEGTITWTAPSGGVACGVVVTINTSPSANTGAVTETNDLNLSGGGDGLWAYQGTTSVPIYLAALGNDGSAGAITTGAEGNITGTGLTIGLNAFAPTEVDNLAYTGITTGTKSAILTAINSNGASWSSNNSSQEVFSGTFTISDCGGAIAPEPDNHPSAFSCTAQSDDQIGLTWTDTTTVETMPDGYLIKWSDVSYAAITNPTDGSDSNGANSLTENEGTESASVSDLDPNTQYFFKIWSYTNSGSNIDYKTSAGVPQTNCTTDNGPCFEESFDNNSATGNSYSNGSFTGDEGTVWTYQGARSPSASSGYQITGTSMGFGDSGENPRTLSASAVNGIQSISYDTKTYFTGGDADDRTVEIWVNGVLRDSYTHTIEGLVFSQTVSNINVAGTPLIEFRSTGSRHVVIDNISWTCFSGCTATQTITSFLPTSGPAGTLVTISGAGFTGATAASFSGTTSPFVQVVDDNTLIAEVPESGTSGAVGITVSSCEALSANTFTLLTGNGSCGSSGGGGTFATDLFISEVYDALSGSLSYVEVFNGTNSAIANLATDQYVIRIQTGTTNIFDYSMSGSLASGGTYILRVGSGSSECTGFTPDNNLPSGQGFNGDDNIYLRKNGANIDDVPNPNVGEGFSQSRNSTVTAPNNTYDPTEWTIGTTENCNDLGIPPFVPNGSDITINAQPTDVDCTALSFTIDATADPEFQAGPSGAYTWKYLELGTDSWENVSTLNGAGGLTVTGSNTATISITGPTAALIDYQFYVDMGTSGSPQCRVFSNAAQYTYDTKEFYRSDGNGLWSDAANWLMSDTEGGTPTAACQYPTDRGSSKVNILSGDSILLDSVAITIDELDINSNGVLVIGSEGELFINDGNTSGADFSINGTYYDQASSPDGIAFNTVATWQLDGNATVIKTNTSSVSNYRDNYETGISNIPAAANWIYRRDADNDVAVASTSMFYPNLTFENNVAPAYDPSDVFNFFQGASSAPVVKGNLDIGGVGSEGYVVRTNNTNASPILIQGELIIQSGSTFTNEDISGDDDGTGIEVRGDLTIEGALQLQNGIAGRGQLVLSGTGDQIGIGDGFSVLVNEFEINKPSGAFFTEFSLIIAEEGRFISGIYEIDDGATNPADIEFSIGSSATGMSNASFVDGRIDKFGADSFIFPTGDTNADGIPLYEPARIFSLSGTGGFSARYFAEAHPNAGAYYDGESNNTGDYQEISNCDFWNITRTSGSTVNARIGLTYTNPNNLDGDLTNDNCNSISDETSVFITRWNSVAVDWEQPISEGSSTGSSESTSDGVLNPSLGGYGDFTLTSNSPSLNVLPITLLSFQAKAEERQVHTSWVTASEINNDLFTIERSKDGTNWEVAGREEGAGNSNTALSYAFVDEIPYTGISYYRLRQTDFDGTTTLSAPRAVEILQGNDFGLDRVYRGQDGLSLIYRATAPYVVVEIYDLLGKRIHGELIENYGNGFSTIHPDLARGAYILRLSHGSEMDSEKFVW